MDSLPDLTILHAQEGYGVGLVHARSDRPLFWRQQSLDEHMVFAQLSGPVATTTRFAGRRLRHVPRRRSVGIVPAGADAGVEIEGPIETLGVSVSTECLALAASQTSRHGGALIERLSGEDDAVFAAVQTLRAASIACGSQGILCWSSAADALIRMLAEEHLDLRPASLATLAVDSLTMKRLNDYVRAHLASPLDLVSLAAVAGSDRFRFARAFRAATGLTPHRYVMRLRLQRARELIEEGTLPLVDIALATGFCDQSHMSRWVRRCYGVTPGAMSGRRIFSQERPRSGRRRTRS